MKPTILSTIFVSVMAIVIAGCGGASSAPSQTGDGTAETPAAHDQASHDHVSTGTGMEKMKAELAKLSPEDAVDAEKQHFCPVSGEMLGAMGAPIKVNVKGETAWLCCDSCKQEILDNPDEYLAKLHKE